MKLRSRGSNLLSCVLVRLHGTDFLAGLSCIRKDSCSLEAVPHCWGWGLQVATSLLSFPSHGIRSQSRRLSVFSLGASGVVWGTAGWERVTLLTKIKELQKPVVFHAPWKARRTSECYGRICRKMAFCSVQIIQCSVFWLSFVVLAFLTCILN